MRLDGARDKKQVWRPMFEVEVCRKQMYCIEEVLVTLLGLFGDPRSDSAPGISCPPSPLVTPLLAGSTPANNQVLSIKSGTSWSADITLSTFGDVR